MDNLSQLFEPFLQRGCQTSTPYSEYIELNAYERLWTHVDSQGMLEWIDTFLDRLYSTYATLEWRTTWSQLKSTVGVWMGDRPRRESQIYPCATFTERTYPDNSVFIHVHHLCECFLWVYYHCLSTYAQTCSLDQIHQATIAIRMYTLSVSLLKCMDRVSYAPLRVALRDASGAQSFRAQHRTQVFMKLWRACFPTETAMHFFRVLADPLSLPHVKERLDAFYSLAQSLEQSRVGHSQVVRHILGMDVYGTLGYKVAVLAEKAAHTLLPDVQKGIEYFTLWSSLKYAMTSGHIIQACMNDQVRDTPSSLSVTDQQRSVLEVYFSAIQTQSLDTWLRLFHSDAVLIDPPGTRAYHGHEPLTTFFKNFQRLFPTVHKVTYTVESQSPLCVHWCLDVRTFLKDMDLSLCGKELFFFRGEKLAKVVTLWSPDQCADVLLQRVASHLEGAGLPVCEAS